jgi:hypothetical protein
MRRGRFHPAVFSLFSALWTAGTVSCAGTISLFCANNSVSCKIADLPDEAEGAQSRAYPPFSGTADRFCDRINRVQNRCRTGT